MSHFAFIAASYGVATLGLGLLAAWLLVDYGRQRRTLADLEARGIGKRSRRETGDAP
ncbi:heme exporter protein CcmD [Xanthobacter oligotrophicus]|uniref:heme exporter protein CcmD n=1 Tax=Xanthobacter oligotrophicus TaxID=2607286 RepID=UPI0011F30D4C|nr:heme exporter protein CcmD [Xanthobacter oligotrophicus]MCG5234020.1 heme exporter protein CcmD [Xanthobacter oligotrophicus]